MTTQLPSKDPANKEPYFIVWCDKSTGLNDGSRKDRGELQGATIVTAEWTVPEEITKESSNQAAVSIAGISYEQDTVTTIWLSGGTADENYSLSCLITISDGRTLDSKTIVIPVREE
jgi:hypothetical protein